MLKFESMHDCLKLTIFKILGVGVSRLYFVRDPVYVPEKGFGVSRTHKRNSDLLLFFGFFGSSHMFLCISNKAYLLESLPIRYMKCQKAISRSTQI